MKFFKYFIGLLSTAAVFTGLFFVCGYFGSSAKSFYMDVPGKTATGGIDFSKTSVDKLVENYVNGELEQDITVTAVGDMLFYQWQLERSYDAETDTYDFTPSFANIKKYFAESDYLVGDLETTLAGKDQGADKSYNGYGADRLAMKFNTPEILAQNLAQTGFDMITVANEHAFDSGTAGFQSTVSRLREAGIETAGVAMDDAPYVIKNIENIKIGFIAYTNVMPEIVRTDAQGNVISDSATGDYSDPNYAMVNHLGNYDAEKIRQMCAQIEQMRGEGAEAVVVLLHFGETYGAEPSEQDQQLAHQLIDAGADVILGSHSHVPEPIEIVDVQKEDGSARRGLIVYSMGNFLTSQQYIDGTGQYRDMGMLCEIIFKKVRDTVFVGGLNITPVYSNWAEASISTVPVIEAHNAPDHFEGIFDDYALGRINDAFESIFPQVLADSGVTYKIEDYKYKISLEK